MSLDAGISSLIERIYDSVSDHALWDGVVEELVQRSRARFAFVATIDTRHRALSSSAIHGCDDSRLLDGVREYEQEIYRHDPAILFACANPSARLFDTHRAIPANEYLADPYIRWSGDRLGSTHWQVAYTAPEDDLSFGIALHRTKDRGPLGVEGTRLFTMLFSHMERAKRLSVRPPDFSGSTEAIIAIDGRGQVVAVSGAAEGCLAVNDGIKLVHGALRCRSQAKLDGLIRSALEAKSKGGIGGAFAAERPSGKRPWVVTVMPLGRAEGPFAFFQAVALVRIIDPQVGPAPDAPARWNDIYAFTPAESRLAEELLRGESNIRVTADRLGIAYATARVQLASLFMKCGVNSQSQLVRLLTRIEF